MSDMAGFEPQQNDLIEVLLGSRPVLSVHRQQAKMAKVSLYPIGHLVQVRHPGSNSRTTRPS